MDVKTHNNVILRASDPFLKYNEKDFNTIEEYELYKETKDYLNEYGPENHEYTNDGWKQGTELREEGNNLNHFFDPYNEKMPAKIRSGKPRCPKCNVPATDIGTCPYCGHIVELRWKPVKSKEEYEIVTVNGKSKWTTRFIKIDNTYFENDAKINFKVKVNRNHGGYVNYQTYHRIISNPSESEKPNGKTHLRLHKVEIMEPCDCGSKFNLVDLRHGDILCPTCGLIHGKIELVNQEGGFHY